MSSKRLVVYDVENELIVQQCREPGCSYTSRNIFYVTVEVLDEQVNETLLCLPHLTEHILTLDSNDILLICSESFLPTIQNALLHFIEYDDAARKRARETVRARSQALLGRGKGDD